MQEILYEVKDEYPANENIYTSSRFPAQQASSRVIQFNRSSSPKINFNITSPSRTVASAIQPSRVSSPPPLQQAPIPFTSHNNKDLLPMKSMTTVTALRN